MSKCVSHCYFPLNFTWLHSIIIMSCTNLYLRPISNSGRNVYHDCQNVFIYRFLQLRIVKIRATLWMGILFVIDSTNSVQICILPRCARLPYFLLCWICLILTHFSICSVIIHKQLIWPSLHHWSCTISGPTLCMNSLPSILAWQEDISEWEQSHSNKVQQLSFRPGFSRLDLNICTGFHDPWHQLSIFLLFCSSLSKKKLCKLMTRFNLATKRKTR